MADVTADPALSVCFKVKIDGHDLGAFTGCEGLGCEVTIEQHEEGGNNGFVYQLPGRIKYSNIKLTRAVTREGAKLVAQWFAKMAKHGIERTTAHIVAMSADGEQEIWEWTLSDVIPVRWQGPSLSAESPKVATETLELAHHGFLAAS
ncbi:MAG TPA: phage tail protein [Actinomycetes bacterium]